MLTGVLVPFSSVSRCFGAIFILYKGIKKGLWLLYLSHVINLTHRASGFPGQVVHGFAALHEHQCYLQTGISRLQSHKNASVLPYGQCSRPSVYHFFDICRLFYRENSPANHSFRYNLERALQNSRTFLQLYLFYPFVPSLAFQICFQLLYKFF
ncbi:uncharacterized protein LOC111918019 [Lactuca sativa]|uniref:uncharacterized protein LOC111918019 n=1 Tax=Lactuca sativa TaxID=4236 RepID=UPI001C689ED4|nr:uncharacterized protein LOC111918019 [Lactuca sativa]XP_042753744.1 uncharacterized protein LOC111918019 [Lactuca sativa]